MLEGRDARYPLAVPAVAVVRHVDDATRALVSELATRSADVDGYRFLSDHLWLDLQSGGELIAACVHRDDHLVAYAQASQALGGWIIEATVHPDDRRGNDDDLLADVVGTLLDAVRHGGGERVTWWIHDVSESESAVAMKLGLSPDRDLLQMQRSLPTGLTVTVATRSFRRGEDERALLDVNNRAFADHVEQGGWDLDSLRRRQRETWFDADGIRLHERDGRLAAFCWTKLHDSVAGVPRLGEIYVIAVDPDFQGLGLGKQLTLAGLGSIEQRGVTDAMLYVDGSNSAAMTMYRRLGFWQARHDRSFAAALTPSSVGRASGGGSTTPDTNPS